jgi:hypothetical protein
MQSPRGSLLVHGKTKSANNTCKSYECEYEFIGLS